MEDDFSMADVEGTNPDDQFLVYKDYPRTIFQVHNVTGLTDAEIASRYVEDVPCAKVCVDDVELLLTPYELDSRAFDHDYELLHEHYKNILNKAAHWIVEATMHILSNKRDSGSI